MSRRHLCDTPGCGRIRGKWQRLCTRCFTGMPAGIRDRLLIGWKFHKPKWRAAKREAGKWLAARIDTGSSITARLLGEHDEDRAA